MTPNEHACLNALSDSIARALHRALEPALQRRERKNADFLAQPTALSCFGTSDEDKGQPWWQIR